MSKVDSLTLINFCKDLDGIQDEQNRKDLLLIFDRFVNCGHLSKEDCEKINSTEYASMFWTYVISLSDDFNFCYVLHLINDDEIPLDIKTLNNNSLLKWLCYHSDYHHNIPKVFLKIVQSYSHLIRESIKCITECTHNDKIMFCSLREVEKDQANISKVMKEWIDNEKDFESLSMYFVMNSFMTTFKYFFDEMYEYEHQIPKYYYNLVKTHVNYGTQYDDYLYLKILKIHRLKNLCPTKEEEDKLFYLACSHLPSLAIEMLDQEYKVNTKYNKEILMLICQNMNPELLGIFIRRYMDANTMIDGCSLLALLLRISKNDTFINNMKKIKENINKYVTDLSIYILDSGFNNINHVDQYGYTPFLIACIFEYVELVKYMLNKYDVNIHFVKYQNGKKVDFTLIELCRIVDKQTLLNVLSEHSKYDHTFNKENINVTDNLGYSILHLVAEKGYYSVCKRLLELGCKKINANIGNQIPYDIVPSEMNDLKKLLKPTLREKLFVKK